MQIHQQVATLRDQLQRFSNGAQTQLTGKKSSGSDEIDRQLLGGGFRSGNLVEWIAEGSLAKTASLLTAREWVSERRPAVLIDPQKQIFPPALAAAGFDLRSLVVLHPRNERDLLWTWEQALACNAVSLVWGEMETIAPVPYRRLKLAAEQSGVIGFLLRSTQALHRPTWADVRLLVRPQPSSGESPRFELKSYAGSGMKNDGVVIEFTPSKTRTRNDGV